MEIDYTDYAEMRIMRRELSKSQIESVIKNPDTGDNYGDNI